MQIQPNQGQSRKAKLRRMMREFNQRSKELHSHLPPLPFHWNRARKRMHKHNPRAFYAQYPDAPGNFFDEVPPSQPPTPKIEAEAEPVEKLRLTQKGKKKNTTPKSRPKGKLKKTTRKAKAIVDKIVQATRKKA